MIFHYEDYHYVCFEVRLFLLIVFILVALNMIIYVTKQIATKQFEFIVQEGLKMLLGIAFLAFFLSMQIGTLADGGIYLAQEKEEDAIVAVGEIKSIKNLNEFTFPKIKTDYGSFFGVEMQIGDIRCTMPTAGEFKPGDTVHIKYLPKSGYVLEISAESFE